jgi:hypothetical protein
MIPPDSWLHVKTDMHFVLAQRCLQSDVYKDFYAQEDKFKILDHGIYESDMMDFDDTLKIADEISAHEIILPDEIRVNHDKEFYEDLLSTLPRNYKYMVVPQADDPYNWCMAYNDLKSLEVDTIGIPIWLHKDFRARSTVVNYLFKQGLMDMSKEHHLLGLDNYWELIEYPSGVIRSVDTSLPFSMAWSNEQSKMFEEPAEHKRVDVDCALFSVPDNLLQEELAMLHTVTRLV